MYRNSETSGQIAVRIIGTLVLILAALWIIYANTMPLYVGKKGDMTVAQVTETKMESKVKGDDEESKTGTLVMTKSYEFGVDGKMYKGKVKFTAKRKDAKSEEDFISAYKSLNSVKVMYLRNHPFINYPMKDCDWDELGTFKIALHILADVGVVVLALLFFVVPVFFKRR